MPVDPTWAIPLGGAAIRNREEIAGAWSRLVNRILGKHSQLAMTGMPGAGKSVLLDHLTGQAFDAKYKPPSTSAQVERETLRRSGQRLGLAVLPGQSTPSRLRGIDELFLGKKLVRGVVHVVSFGYTETRSDFAVEEMKERDLDALREIRLEEELRDLQATCESIRSHWNRHHEALWLMVAVNKVDLYSDTASLEAAYARYGKNSAGPFTDVVNELTRQVGADNFEWQSMPVCSWLEDFKWAGKIVESKLDMSQRNELLMRLSGAVSARCEGAKDA